MTKFSRANKFNARHAYRCLACDGDPGPQNKGKPSAEAARAPKGQRKERQEALKALTNEMLRREVGI